MTIAAIEKITRRASRIAARKDSKITPGQATRLSEAASVNDAVRQGDLYLVVVTAVPKEYVAVERPTNVDRQLVPGNTEGARHCLDSLDGVMLYRPASWPDSGLLGPCFVSTLERTVEHPIHGHVTIPAGMMILCGYQRDWDAVAKMERRNAD